jgi:hypothetical protein
VSAEQQERAVWCGTTVLISRVPPQGVCVCVCVNVQLCVCVIERESERERERAREERGLHNQRPQAHAREGTSRSTPQTTYVSGCDGTCQRVHHFLLVLHIGHFLGTAVVQKSVAKQMAVPEVSATDQRYEEASTWHSNTTVRNYFSIHGFGRACRARTRALEEGASSAAATPPEEEEDDSARGRLKKVFAPLILVVVSV